MIMPQKRLPQKFKETTSSQSNPAALLSSCLVGIKSRYDGNHKLRKGLLRQLGKCLIIPVCPEQLGGLPTPRSRAEIVGGNGFDVLKGEAKVINSEGHDVTAQFIKGAREALRMIRLNKIERVFLKEGSPSCGVERFGRREKQTGPGVTTALLLKEGIRVLGVD